jgi:3-hydroxybutyryl-CoA dehydrogenase
MKKIGVAGIGTMGHGIALVSAKAGYDVLLYHPQNPQKGIDKIEAVLEEEIRRNNSTPQIKNEILRKITPIHKLNDFENADLIIEAIKEDLDAKKMLFASLDKICKPHTIFASNTSTLSISEMAKATERRDKVVGIHFFAPPYKIPLVELIRGKETSEDTFAKAEEYSEKTDRIIVEAADTPGFIANRILMPMINEAVFMFWEKIATKEDIDMTMQIGINQPMGPLFLADFVGIDIVLSAMETLYRELGEKYRPCPLLKEMVEEGKLGRKTGIGFYCY